MRKLSLIVALFGLFCMPLFANDLPKVEAYGGYGLLHGSTNFANSGTPFKGTGNGFVGAGEFNINPTIGIVGEFGLAMRSDSGVSTKDAAFLGGLRMGYRAERYRIFYDLKLGVNHIGSGTSSSNGFALVPVGAGVDININQRITIRPAQIDLIRVRLGSTPGIGGFGGSTSIWQNLFRYSAGVVINFGEKI